MLSLPLWLYRVAMLLWALWLAAGLVRGVGPAWRAFSEGGLWRPIPRTPRAPKPPEPSEPPKEDPAPEGLSASGAPRGRHHGSRESAAASARREDERDLARGGSEPELVALDRVARRRLK